MGFQVMTMSDEEHNYDEMIHIVIDTMSDWFDNFEDELEDSFFWTLEQVLKPYCDELKDSSIEFHLDGRKT